ncbi:MAG: YceI family protein [Verrucomicrobiota bacterium]
MNTRLRLAALLLATTAALTAAPISFDFKDPKGVNAVSFHLDSLLEPIAGTADGVSGTVSYDPAAPAATTGSVTIAAKSLKVTNSTMNEHLLSAGWIDAAGHPEITFTIKSLANAKTDGNTTKADATGDFTLKGVTKEITVPVTITHLPGAFGKRINKPEVGGDLLVVRGQFSIQRADYGIKPGQNEDKVSPQIDLSLALVGSAPDA